jgi:hypothetical protein
MDIDVPEPLAPGLIDYPDSELPDSELPDSEIPDSEFPEPEATHCADNYPTIYLLLVG